MEDWTIGGNNRVGRTIWMIGRNNTIGRLEEIIKSDKIVRTNDLDDWTK